MLRYVWFSLKLAAADDSFMETRRVSEGRAAKLRTHHKCVPNLRFGLPSLELRNIKTHALRDVLRSYELITSVSLTYVSGYQV